MSTVTALVGIFRIHAAADDDFVVTCASTITILAGVSPICRSKLIAAGAREVLESWGAENRPSGDIQDALDELNVV